MLRCIKRFFRDNTVGDLRLIDYRFRSLYRDRFIGKTIGTKLRILNEAYLNGHFR